jgi:hypothetical protein
MGRKFLAVIVAMITAVAIIWVGFMISSMMAPFYPKNIEYMSHDDIAAYMQTVPVSTFITVLIGYGVAATCFAGLAISLVVRRESGVLKRVRSTPLPPATYIVSVLGSTFLVFLIEAAVIMALGRTISARPAFGTFSSASRRAVFSVASSLWTRRVGLRSAAVTLCQP